MLRVEPVKRGYLNAVAVGLLLVAAMQLIPQALSEIEFVGYSLFASYVITPLKLDSAPVPWAYIFQGTAQSLGVILILVLFLRGNGARSAGEPAVSASPAGPTLWQRWLSLPAADQVDRVCIFLTAIGLSCYNLWLGANQAPPTGHVSAQSFVATILLVIIGAGLGVVTLGLLPQPQRQWPWLAGTSVCLGLAIIAGLTGLAAEIILMLAPLILSLGAVCQVYLIGRLLRILQDQVGLGWRTSLTVGASAVALYCSLLFIGRLL